MSDTEVQTTMRTAYLAGPMRGIEDYNFPAFKAAASWLRSKGWSIYSPAERDEEDPDILSNQDLRVQMGDDWDWSGTHGLDYFMSFDLRAVCASDAVICLPGWEDSQGARLETMVAVEVGHPVFELTQSDGTSLGHKKNGSLKFGNAKLTAVNADYVRAVFAAESLTMHAVSNGDGTITTFEPQSLDAHRCVEPVGAADPVLSAEESGSMLPLGSTDRKNIPITSGVLDYFPAALIEVAKVSKAGNDKHNPGQPLHHARSKSTDHADSLLRHLIDRGKVDADTGCRHSAEVAWRVLALLQEELEAEGLAPLPRGASLS